MSGVKVVYNIWCIKVKGTSIVESFCQQYLCEAHPLFNVIADLTRTYKVLYEEVSLI